MVDSQNPPPLPKKTQPPTFKHPHDTPTKQILHSVFSSAKTQTNASRFHSIPGVFSECPVDFESKERNSDEDGIQKNDGLEKEKASSWKFQPWNDGKKFHQLDPLKTTHSCIKKMVLSYVFHGAVQKQGIQKWSFPMFVQGTHHLFGGASML